MPLSLADMVKIGLRLIQYRNEISALVDKIFGGTQVARAVEVTPQYDVKWVQQSLNHLLHPNVKLEVDGQMGERTRGAIERYQKERGLLSDGWLGPVTMASLEADIRAAHARAGR